MIKERENSGMQEKKRLRQRLQNIAYTIFPDRTVDSFTNVPIRCANLFKSNVPTVAYENVLLAKGCDEGGDRNFVRDYYLNKESGGTNMSNNIVKDLEEDMAKASAYTLASKQSEAHKIFIKQKQSAAINSRQRSVSRYNQHFKEQKEKKQAELLENQKWLKKLYRKLEEVSRHIVEGEGENTGEREKLFLLSKTNLTAAYLGQIKVRNPKVAFQILEQIRTLMLKKKLRFEEQRQEQQQNKSVSMSFSSQVSGNFSQNSILSQATSLNQSNIFGQDKVIDKYADFEALMKKWGIQNTNQVKMMLRRVLTKQAVAEAEIQAVKQKKEASRIIQEMNKSKQNKYQQKKETKSKSKLKRKYHRQSRSHTTKIPASSQNIMKHKDIPTLTPADIQTKEKFLSSGQFDAVGEKYQRNRNFSQMFERKQNDQTIQFSIRKQQNNTNILFEKSFTSARV